MCGIVQDRQFSVLSTSELLNIDALVSQGMGATLDPCRYHGDMEKNCTCSANVVARYQKRISGPLFDALTPLSMSHG
jgi:Magnesium chelatase, subunit ChlI